MGVIKLLSNKVSTVITYLIRLVIGYDCFAPSKSFFELRVVRLSFGLCSAIALASTITIIKTSNLAIDLSFIGFNHAITVFKFPIAAIAVLIPLIAVLAANHRSVQTREAMRLTESQNKFANYYKHLEEFEKHVDKIVEHDAQHPIDARAIYSICFKNREFNLSEDLIEHLMKIANDTIQCENELLSSDPNTKIEGIRSLARAINEIENLFQTKITFTYKTKMQNKLIQRKSDDTPGNETQSLATKLILHMIVIQRIIFFDLNHPKIFESSIQRLRKFQKPPVVSS